MQTRERQKRPTPTSRLVRLVLHGARLRCAVCISIDFDWFLLSLGNYQTVNSSGRCVERILVDVLCEINWLNIESRVGLIAFRLPVTKPTSCQHFALADSPPWERIAPKTQMGKNHEALNQLVGVNPVGFLLLFSSPWFSLTICERTQAWGEKKSDTSESTRWFVAIGRSVTLFCEQILLSNEH